MKNFSEKYIFVLAITFVLLLITASALAQTALPAISLENAADLAEITTIDLGASPPYQFAFSPDGTKLAVSDLSGIRVFDTETGEAADYLVETYINDPVFSPDGTLISGYSVSCNPGFCSGTVYVFDASTGEEQLAIPYESGYVDASAFSADGTRLAYGLSQTYSITEGVNRGTGLGPSAVHVVDLATGDEILAIDEERGILGPLFFSPDGTKLAYNAVVYETVYGDPGSGELHIIDLANGEEIGKVSAGYLVVAISSDWTKALIDTKVSLPGTYTISSLGPFVVDIETGERVFAPEDMGLYNLAFTPDWTVMFISSMQDDQYTLSIRDASTNEEITALTIEDIKYLNAAVFSPDGTHLATYYSLNTDSNLYLRIWGIPS